MPLIVKILIVYYILINIVLLFTMGVDKRAAQDGRWRVPERTLFFLGLLGGGIGGLLGMLQFHHKTKKPLFYLVFLLSIALHGYLLYRLW